MNKITLTKRGREILSQNTLQGGEAYWVGYFGLAYVPDQSGFDEEQTRLIGPGEHGDYIYNIWQGDLVSGGSSTTDAQFSKLTLYDRNITSNFRYVYDDENDRNRLVTWVSESAGNGVADSETASYTRTGYRVYKGITLGDSNDTGDITSESELPCPAPLFYAGGSVSYGNALSEGDFVNSVAGNDWPMHKNGDTEVGAYPMVTPDMRVYGGSWAGGDTGSGWDWVPAGARKYDTIPASTTRNDSGTTLAKDDCLNQYAEFISVSNFNKEHGHVSSEGYGVGYQESCHNMSMVTRLFPIAKYELTATTEPSTSDGNISERGSAKSIKYVVGLNLAAAYEGVRTYLDTLNYTQPEAPGMDQEDVQLFTSATPNSFKFNRIGIYAVRATVRRFYKEGDAGNRSDCRATHYQMEISPDARPELFAVMQVDEVRMSEDAKFGLGNYNTTFVLNLENTSENDLCTNPEVYYNLVENEAITWYQNQLIATAGLSEAVTNLGVNMAYLMNGIGKGMGSFGCLNSSVERIQAESYTGLKNLVDDDGEGSVKNVMSADSGRALPALGKDAGGWTSGVLSLTMGDNNATLGDYSFNLTVNGDIDENSKHVLLAGGEKPEITEPDRYIVVKNSDYSLIIGKPGEYAGVHNSIVMLGSKTEAGNGITGATDSLLFDTGRFGNIAVFRNSTVDLCGSDIVSGNGYTELYPATFKNVVWHGSARAIPHHPEEEIGEGCEYKNELYRAPLHDVIVLMGEGTHELYDWLGTSADTAALYARIKGSCVTHDPSVVPLRDCVEAENFAQPYSTSMLFTGGLALGGHLVYGSEALGDGVDYYKTAGTYGLLKLGTAHNDRYSAHTNVDLYRNTACASLMVSGGSVEIYHGNVIPPSDSAGDDVSPMKMYAQSLSQNQYHYAVHSPHAGKPLVSGETQELDGTLHIGLGQDYRYGNTGATKVTTSYITVDSENKIYGLRLSIDCNAEANYVLEGRWSYSDAPDKSYDANGDSEREHADYYLGPDSGHMTHAPSGTAEIEDSEYSGVGLRMEYHWHSGLDDRYTLVIEKLRILVPTDMPNYYVFDTGYWPADLRGIEFADGVAQTLYVKPCRNITDTNIYLDYQGPTILGEQNPLLMCTAARIAGGSLCAARMVERMSAADCVYRLSASNYHGNSGYGHYSDRPDNTSIMYSEDNGYPMRVEKIPAAVHYAVEEAAGEETISATYRFIDVNVDSTLNS